MSPEIAVPLKSAALLTALVYIAIGVVGLVSPATLLTAREYLGTPVGHYAGGAVRLVMGIALILCAPASRFPKILRVLGAVMCLQGLVAAFSSVALARTVMELERPHTALLRLGALVALGSGGIIAFAVAAGRGSTKRKAALKGPPYL